MKSCPPGSQSLSGTLLSFQRSEQAVYSWRAETPQPMAAILLCNASSASAFSPAAHRQRLPFRFLRSRPFSVSPGPPPQVRVPGSSVNHSILPLKFLVSKCSSDYHSHGSSVLIFVSLSGIYALSSNDIKVGTNIEVDGAPWQVLGCSSFSTLMFLLPNHRLLLLDFSSWSDSFFTLPPSLLFG